MFIPAFLSSPLAFSVPTFVRNLLPILTAGLGAPVLKLGAVVGVPSWSSLQQWALTSAVRETGRAQPWGGAGDPKWAWG